MNEIHIIVGDNADGPGHYAMLANTHTVFSGTTREEAIKELLADYVENNRLLTQVA